MVMLKNISCFFTILGLPFYIGTFQIFGQKQAEPIVLLPVKYHYETAYSASLNSGIMQVPVSTALYAGLENVSPEITELALTNNALDFISSEDLHQALSTLLTKRTNVQVKKYLSHVCLLPIDCALATAVSGIMRELNRHPRNIPRIVIPLGIVLHILIHKFLKTKLTKFDDVIRLMLQHKAFSRNNHAAINKQLKHKILQHFDKKQLKKIAGAVDSAPVDAAQIEQ